MLNNAQQVEQLLQTNGKGAKAQVGYDLTLKSIKRIHGGSVFADKTEVLSYTDEIITTQKGKQVYELFAFLCCDYFVSVRKHYFRTRS
jgi:hypothetical protein